MPDKPVTLRVTRKGHNHGGERFEVGQTFPGTLRLLEAFKDRLELVEPAKAAEPKPEPAKAATPKAKG